MADLTFGCVSYPSELNTRRRSNSAGHMAIMMAAFVSSSCLSALSFPLSTHHVLPVIIKKQYVADLAVVWLDGWIEPLDQSSPRLLAALAWRVVDDGVRFDACLRSHEHTCASVGSRARGR